VLILLAGPAAADLLRLAVWHTGLSQEGPGLLLREIRAGSPGVMAARDLIVAARPDVVLLLDIDHDHRGAALAALQARLAEAGHPMPHAHAPPPNAGVATGIDMDGDGRAGRLDDAQGWGRFQGAGGMALLSRHPIDTAGAQDLSGFLWRDLPGARLPEGTPPAAAAIQRLASRGFWIVPVAPPDGPPLVLMAWHAGPPAFGRVPGRNRARNHDEAAFWRLLLGGALPVPAPEGAVVLIGNANADPARGDGDPAAIRTLLAHPRLQDPAPGTYTAVYAPPGPGRLRTTYLLPEARLAVAAAGQVWPAPPARHALVWVDLVWPPP
jgi:hypothetical protein